MATFGSFALLIALALAAYNLLAGSFALRLLATGQPARVSPERLADTARRAGIAGFVAITAAAFALVWSVFANDFSITYILEHSNRALPGAYKFSALWSGQEGSLLLWAWLLGTYGFVLRLTHKTDVKLYAYAGTILAGVQVFFLAIINFAAESHVDRSINSAGEFLQTNIIGTQVLLDAARERAVKRFVQVSTDEVMGSLVENDETYFTEASPFAPNSPYAASKAAAEHLVRAAHHTPGLMGDPRPRI